MADFATLTIDDGQTSPAAHSFTTAKRSVLPNGELFYQWLDFSVNGGVPIGANRLEMIVSMPQFGSNGARAKTAGAANQSLTVATKIVLPTLETLSNNTSTGIDPQPTHAYDTVFWTKLVRNGRAVSAPVKDALAFFRNFSWMATYTDTVLTFAPPGN